MALTISNRFKYEKGVGSIDLSSCTVKAALMNDSFTFDPASHETWTDVSLDEITGADGYTSGGATLTVESAWTQDNVNNKALIQWADETLATTGSDWPGSNGSILYVSSHANQVIIGYIDFIETVVVTDVNPIDLYDLIYEHK